MVQNGYITMEEQESQILICRVKYIRSSGALVELPDRRVGWMPAQETYPDFKPHDDFPKRARELQDMDIEVVELGTTFGGRQTLVSHVRARNDPWTSIATWRNGDVKVMEVGTTTKTHAIGVIEPGIRARVRVEASSMLPQSWNGFDMPLPGDTVAGFFYQDQVDHDNRIVELDYAAYVRSEVSVGNILSPSLGNSAPSASSTDSSSCEYGSDRRATAKAALRDIQTVLIVDDDRSFLGSLCNFMNGLGCQVLSADSQAGAEEIVASPPEPIDLAIIDLHLTDRREFEGFSVASKLAAEQDGCRIIVVSAESTVPAKERLSNFAYVPTSALLSKPFGRDELLDALEVSSREPAKTLGEFMAFDAPRDLPYVRSQTESSSVSELDSVCESLRQATRAEAVALFSVHPVSYAVQMPAKADPHTLLTKVERRLDCSPVRDVALDLEDVFTSHASDARNEPKHRWLLRAYKYESCVGVPVQPKRAVEVGYALFAFHRQRDSFTSLDLFAAKQAAETMKYMFDAMSFEAELRQMKPFELMGKVYGSMAHDLGTAIHNAFVIDDLQEALDKNDMRTANEKIAILRDKSQRAKNVVATFRAMAQGQNAEISEFRIEEVLPPFIQSFRPEAEAYNSHCELVPYIGEPCLVRMRRSGLEQIIFNLLLNSTQQIERLKCLRKGRGEVKVELRRVRGDDGNDWAVILVHDNGPGIHRRDFEKIFDLHYTTKEDGCGMGLDICRKIATSVVKNDRVGTLRVQRSILLAGTIFMLRLPI